MVVVAVVVVACNVVFDSELVNVVVRVLEVLDVAAEGIGVVVDVTALNGVCVDLGLTGMTDCVVNGIVFPLFVVVVGIRVVVDERAWVVVC